MTSNDVRKLLDRKPIDFLQNILQKNSQHDITSDLAPFPLLQHQPLQSQQSLSFQKELLCKYKRSINELPQRKAASTSINYDASRPRAYANFEKIIERQRARVEWWAFQFRFTLETRLKIYYRVVGISFSSGLTSTAFEVWADAL